METCAFNPRTEESETRESLRLTDQAVWPERPVPSERAFLSKQGELLVKNNNSDLHLDTHTYVSAHRGIYPPANTLACTHLFRHKINK